MFNSYGYKVKTQRSNSSYLERFSFTKWFKNFLGEKDELENILFDLKHSYALQLMRVKKIENKKGRKNKFKLIKIFALIFH